METSILQHFTKIKQTLDKLINLKVNVCLEPQLKKLLKILEEVSNERASSIVPVFTEWLTTAVVVWWANKIKPLNCVLSFALNVGACLVKDEKTFLFLNDNSIILRLFQVSKERDSSPFLSIQLDYVKLLSSLLNHRLGVEWIITHNSWAEVLQNSLSCQKNLLFIEKFLDRVVDVNPSFCDEVVKKIMAPFSDNINIKSLLAASASDLALFDNIESAFELVANMLEYFLDVFHYKGDPRVLYLFLTNFNLEAVLHVLEPLDQQKITFDFYKIIFIKKFFELYIKVTNNTISKSDAKEIIYSIQNNYVSSISRENISDVQKLSFFAHIFWLTVSSKFSFCEAMCNNCLTTYTNQFMVLEIQIHLNFILKHCVEFEDIDPNKIDGFAAFFIQKLIKMQSPDILSILFFWKNNLPDPDLLLELCINSLKRFQSLRKYYSKDQAILVFQSLFYTIRSIGSSIESSKKVLDFVGVDYIYCSLIFETLYILINEFEVSWQDGLESVEVMEVSINFLRVFNWPSKLIVQILKIVEVTITRYMTPNLALLVDKTANSPIEFLGSLLVKTLSDNDSLVKEASLKIVASLARISTKNFPSFEIILLERKIPFLVTRILYSERQHFVKTAALCCLQDLILLNITEVESLVSKVETILQHETDTNLKIEAVKFLRICYQQNKIKNPQKTYVVMVASLSTNLHYEIKLQILCFWKCVIKIFLENAGMTDGSFPSIIFSKEHKKIITMTEMEIKKRLKTVLQSLSSIECLKALVSVIKGDCDLKVCKFALDIVKEFLDLLARYNVFDESSTLDKHDTLPDYDDMIATNICWKKTKVETCEIVTSEQFLSYKLEDYVRWMEEKSFTVSGFEDLGCLFDEISSIIAKKHIDLSLALP